MSKLIRDELDAEIDEVIEYHCDRIFNSIVIYYT